MSKHIITYSFLLLLFFNTAGAQAPAIEWQKCIGGTGNQAANCIQPTSDMGYIVCGYFGSTISADDFGIVKLDATGNVQWQKTYGGTGDDRANSIQQTTDGGYIVAGTTNSSNSGDVGLNHGLDDYWIIKLNSTGNIVWQKLFGGSNRDFAWSVQQTTDAGYVIVGMSLSSDGDITASHGGGDYWIVKLDASGTLMWQKSLGGTSVDEAKYIRQTTDGGYIVTGSTGSVNGDITNPVSASGTAWIVKLDATGNIQWQKAYGSIIGGEYSWGICQTNDGGYAFTGICNANGGNVSGHHGLLDYWVVKLDASGNLVWQKVLGGSSIEQPTAIIQCADGGIVVAGWTTSIDGDVTGNHGGADYWIVKLSSTGSLIWQKALGGNSGEQDYSICQAADLGFVIAGHTNSNNSGDVGSNPGAPANDCWVVKLAPNLVPVILVGFDAILKGNDVLCSWQTEQEQNSSHFIIERSDDGLHFDSKGKVAAAGNSSNVLEYNFTDPNAGISNKEFLYYRLKMADLDAKFKYSNVARVKPAQPAISIYPNPVVNDLNISFTSLVNEQATLLLFNEVGAKVHEQIIPVIPGNNSFTLAMQSYSPGSYTILLTGQNRYQARFIVQRPNRF